MRWWEESERGEKSYESTTKARGDDEEEDIVMKWSTFNFFRTFLFQENLFFPRVLCSTLLLVPNRERGYCRSGNNVEERAQRPAAPKNRDCTLSWNDNFVLLFLLPSPGRKEGRAGNKITMHNLTSRFVSPPALACLRGLEWTPFLKSLSLPPN